MLKKARSLILLAGVFVSWTTTINAFSAFYNLEGTIFKIKDCALPNPITTPCFWGAIAFLVTFIWSIKLFKKADLKQEKYLFYFLLASVIFAWGNFIVELNGVKPTPGNVFTPCPATAASPFSSACFYGSILFSLAFIVTFFIKSSNNLKKD